jgi:hypothetical protein
VLRLRRAGLAIDERDGRPVKIGAIANNPDEWLTAITHGYGVSLTPKATTRFYQRPGVTYRPVTGVSPSQVGVAWAPAGDMMPSSATSYAPACATARPPPSKQTPGHRSERQTLADQLSGSAC